ncbi:partial PGL/p-HBAD biosynthesis glycosyltransferase, partial [Anaerolineae bacterium]
MLSVIIPNWNGARLLPVCLNALRQQTCRDFETIVVDDASTDESRELIARDFPEVRVVALTPNRGFAPAVNEGIRTARGAVIVLLNNDTEADANWLAEIVRAL